MTTDNSFKENEPYFDEGYGKFHNLPVMTDQQNELQEKVAKWLFEHRQMDDGTKWEELHYMDVIVKWQKQADQLLNLLADSGVVFEDEDQTLPEPNLPYKQSEITRAHYDKGQEDLLNAGFKRVRKEK